MNGDAISNESTDDPYETIGQSDDLAEHLQIKHQEIGPYSILGVIGDGGMGQVLLAQQNEPVKRKVALKVIRTTSPSEQVLIRFEAERQALAIMDHPNIAKVLDAGMTHDGQPYFAMELVKGIPIIEYCDRHQLTLDDRLILFVQVCQAIQHAHQKGVIHRDLKPSNVLVMTSDGLPFAKVIDFGLAKAIREDLKLSENSLSTQYGQLIGTLEYMSPEQAGSNPLDIDTGTDVYSLGIILFEVLTGSTPIGRGRIRSEPLNRIIELIREEACPRPSSVLSDLSTRDPAHTSSNSKTLRSLKGELDWIVLKALEKNRNRRYETVSELAADITRFLDNEPVKARPPSRSYILNKFVRKHQGAVVGVIAVLATLVVGIIASATFAIDASNQRDRADKRAGDALLAKTNAQAAAQEAIEQSELAFSMIVRIVNDIQMGLQNIPVTSDVRQRLLLTAIEELKTISVGRISTARVDQQSANAFSELGDLILDLGMSRGEGIELRTRRVIEGEAPVEAAKLARSFFSQSAKISQQILSVDPSNTSALRNLWNSKLRLGDIALGLDDVASARALYLDSLGDRSKADVESFMLMTTSQRLARASIHAGKIDEARSLLKETLDDRGLSTLDKTDSKSVEALASVYINLGDLNGQHGAVAESISNLETGTQMVRELLQRNRRDRGLDLQLAHALILLGDGYLKTGNTAKAETGYVEARKIIETHVNEDPWNRTAQLKQSTVLERIGDVSLQKSDLQTAIDAYFQKLEVDQKLVESDPSDAWALRGLGYAESKCGIVRSHQGQLASAKTFLERSVSTRKRLAALDANNVVWGRDLSISYDYLGAVHLELRDFKAAEDCFRAALDVNTKSSSFDSRNLRARGDVANSHMRLGDFYLARQNVTRAVEEYKLAISMCEQLVTAEFQNNSFHRQYAVVLSLLANAKLKQKNVDDAIDLLGKSLDLRRKLASSDPENMSAQSDVGFALARIADIQSSRHEFSVARDLYSEAIEIWRREAQISSSSHDANRNLLITLNQLSDTCLRLGDGTASLAIATEGAIVAKQRDFQDEVWKGETVINFFRLGRAHQSLAEFAKAVECFGYGARLAQSLIESGQEVEQNKHRLELLVSAEKDARFSQRAIAHVNGATQTSDLEDPARFQLLQRCYELGEFFESLARLDESEACFRASIRIASEVDDRSSVRQVIGLAHNRIGNLRLQQGYPEQAMKQYEKFFDLAQERYSTNQPSADAMRDLMIAHNKVADVHTLLYQPVKAMEAYERGLKLAQQIARIAPKAGDSDVGIAYSYYKLAQTLLITSDFAEVENMIAQCREVTEPWADDVSKQESARQLEEDLDSLEIDSRAMRSSTNSIAGSIEEVASLLYRRGAYLAKCSRFKEASECADKLRQLRPANSTDAYNAVCVQALCIGPPVDDAEQHSDRDGRIVKAIESLEDAIQLGFDDFTLAKTDEDLIWLRAHPRFKTVVHTKVNDSGD